MARMIPSSFDPGAVSDGEGAVFSLLENDPITADWTVLHSLDIADHISQVSGEIDFVVIIPRKGVLFLEIKADRSVKRGEDGLWYLGRKKPEKRGPFKQSADGMHSVREYVFKEAPTLKKSVFWSCVGFTHFNFKEKSPEWHDWQVVNKAQIEKNGIGHCLLKVVSSARKMLNEKDSVTWFKSGNEHPSEEEVETLVTVLRPCFEFYESAKDRKARLAGELKKYTSEQYHALDEMDDNPRVAFTAPAGCGKTLLAVEAARRAAIQGRRVLLLCFNELLGSWIKEDLRPLGDNVTAGTLHSLLLQVSRTKVPDTTGARYWEEQLPDAALKRLQNGSEDHLYDVLIIDEAQDLLLSSYLDCLDLMVRGGLLGGTIRIFADFEKQDVMQRADISLAELRSDYIADLAIRRLRVNCRNTPRVAKAAELWGQMKPGYDAVRRADDKQDPEVFTYNGPQDQVNYLRRVLKNLVNKGFGVEDILILSSKAHNSSAELYLEQFPGEVERFGDGPPKGHNAVARYCSTRRFKGLDAPVVILTDIDDVLSEEATSNTYVGITRALERLYVFMSKQSVSQLIQLQSDGGEG